jgi:hypothetical protein
VGRKDTRRAFTIAIKCSEDLPIKKRMRQTAEKILAHIDGKAIANCHVVFVGEDK